MSEGRLVIGTKRYSSWSLRGWLPVRLAGLDVSEEVIPLRQSDSSARITQVSPNGKVPCLEHQSVKVWDSLAIAEYCAELEPTLWPENREARAMARSISAEMHSGFQGVRSAMPMNLGRIQRPLKEPLSEAVIKDIARIDSIWTEARRRFGAGGDYLFGHDFTNADVAFAPIVARFLSYDVDVSGVSRAYIEAVRKHPSVAQWYEEAEREPSEWLVDAFEAIE
ncbi:glutathione S-transferase [Acetobacter aceti NRIC 0242]|uniref:Glutathione S-transferase n=1 Tax=Acetobacter aceti NBRC 14818 TaxID=887700 RepID=A0AB33I7K0_ACEAC|nr:glutathione S-transferase family protein [Acetobacter aceti]TCS34938.1 glutathione S-transferase [Acetobacter aceti NBRC 14818]BCK74482.1 glutathione S-transferase [Acetobacter aceti NBRC 14818]GAN55991.1 glutathione S-transferase [Acetobacter aceti NBRC 14818]GBO80169.1 glutathione S-transferase [Acetobacter aceti NRIC 0242]